MKKSSPDLFAETLEPKLRQSLRVQAVHPVNGRPGALVARVR